MQQSKMALLFFHIIFLTSQPGPGTVREKFHEIESPIWTFFVK